MSSRRSFLNRTAILAVVGFAALVSLAVPLRPAMAGGWERPGPYYYGHYYGRGYPPGYVYGGYYAPPPVVYYPPEPVYVAPPPPVVYAPPPPVYYGPPSLNFGINIPLR
jgi:hypothetical protein